MVAVPAYYAEQTAVVERESLEHGRTWQIDTHLHLTVNGMERQTFHPAVGIYQFDAFVAKAFDFAVDHTFVAAAASGESGENDHDKKIYE